MPMDERAEYYESRCRAAVAMSQAAAAPAIQMIHLDLARRYAELVDASDRDRDMASIMPNPMRTA